MTPDERYEMKMKLAYEMWDEYSNILQREITGAEKSKQRDAEQHLMMVAKELAGDRPRNEKWTDDWFQTLFVTVADHLLERYEIRTEEGSCAEWQAEKLGREMWKIFDDGLEKHLHPKNQRPTPSWRGDRFQLNWVTLAKFVMTKYKVVRK